MNHILMKKNKIDFSFFFLVDFLKDDHENKIFKINNFFGNIESLCSVKFFYFSHINKIDFNLIEKNNNFIFFFLFLNKIFFKDQLKNLKTLLKFENFFFDINALNLKFYLNFYFFFQRIGRFIFLLKFISMLKFYK